MEGPFTFVENTKGKRYHQHVQNAPFPQTENAETKQRAAVALQQDVTHCSD
jgi:hypothetical protein